MGDLTIKEKTLFVCHALNIDPYLPLEEIVIIGSKINKNIDNTKSIYFQLNSLYFDATIEFNP